ncbi:MAG: Ig-like domain-containing protein, partial [Duncaniella sp.]|nr:Ig-like domain-containing protein [Duncaniella sp.]
MTRKLLRVVGLLVCLLGSMSTHAQTYSNEAASVKWPFNSDKEYATDVTGTPEDAFSVMNFVLGDNTIAGTASTTVCPDVKFVRVRAKNGESDLVIWSVKPSKGLTFTPTKISFYIARNGTDGSENCVHVQGRVAGGDLVKFGDVTPHRNNKTQADDKFGKSSSYTTHYEYTLTADQQKSLTSGEGFDLVLNNGFANNKDCMYSDVQIHGLLNGTKVNVEKFAVTAKANIEAAGQVSILPASAVYEKDAEISLKAERNFGYSFVNWTDAAGKVVSEEPEFKHTVTAAAEFTANFKEIPTYELKYAVEGGANLYQVQPSPAGTMIDGKRMYEEGTKVTLTATSNQIVKFTNWNDGQSSSEITVQMDADHTDIVASFDTVDFIAGWDFMENGNQGRVADFATADNDAVSMMLRDEEGNSKSWLDKSQFAAGGYEGRPAAVNWTTDALGKYYWQTTVNASAFTDLKVITAMTYNYNSYTVYDAEYSLDGVNWTKLGSITLNGAKNWIDAEFDLPAAANNQPSVSIRFKADKTSKIDGTNSANDGNALGATFIVGTTKLINDGKAPELVAQVPDNDSEGASINGKIVLTFDEKVKVKEGTVGKLGSFSLTPSVTGKTVMFEYKNLSYSTPYTFTLPSGGIMVLTYNAVN